MTLRSFHSFVLSILILLPLSGCSPLFFMPMTPRLNREDQRQIDASWENMLTPVNRLDRQTLLDTTVTFWLYQLGVDRLHLVSEKNLSHGRVAMEIDCDRASPESDEFVVMVLDERGQTLRRERYARKEVEASVQVLSGAELPASQRNFLPVAQPSTAATTEPIVKPVAPPQAQEGQNSSSERERRMKAVEAATQPAVLR